MRKPEVRAWHDPYPRTAARRAKRPSVRPAGLGTRSQPFHGTPARPCCGRRTVRPQPVREAWSTGAEVAGAPWQTRRPPPPPAGALPWSRSSASVGGEGCILEGDILGLATAAATARTAARVASSSGRPSSQASRRRSAPVYARRVFWLTNASTRRRAVVLGRSTATSGELPVLEPRRRPDLLGGPLRTPRPALRRAPLTTSPVAGPPHPRLAGDGADAPSAPQARTRLCVRLDAGCRCRWFGTGWKAFEDLRPRGSPGSGQRRAVRPRGRRLLSHPADGLLGEPEPDLVAGGVELGPRTRSLRSGPRVGSRAVKGPHPADPADPVLARPLDDDSGARRRSSASRLLGFHKALRTARVLRVSVELVRELFPQRFAQSRISLARADQVQDIHYCLEYLMALKQEL